MKQRLAVIFFFLLLVYACKKDESLTELDFGYDYQPLEVGYWLEYEVDSIFFDDFNARIDTFHFYRREFFESEFLDLNQETNLRVEQYLKMNAEDAWEIAHVGSYKKTVINLQKMEFDLRYIKLVFPPALGKQWQGHLYINVGNQPSLEFLDRDRYDWEYTYTKVHEPLSVGAFSFAECLEVQQIDQENLFEKKYSKEIYARNVGMVSKEMMILETQAPPSDVSFIERAQKGFIVRYTIVNYKQ
jgi:hypothetical protein